MQDVNNRKNKVSDMDIWNSLYYFFNISEHLKHSKINTILKNKMKVNIIKAHGMKLSKSIYLIHNMQLIF